jgi:RNA polymerase sigma factor (TIGR02999 family)
MRLAGERGRLTFQAMELVNEAYLRLLDQKAVSWKNRNHFYAIAAQLMRRILVDDARRRMASKRGGGAVEVTLNEKFDKQERRDTRLIAMDEALERLQVLNPRQSRVVNLRFFAGLDVEKTAEVLGISVATVKREWSAARTWLYREVRGSKG